MITDRDYAKDINEVILEERERCARIADKHHICGDIDCGEHCADAKSIASQIRSGPDPDKPSAEQAPAGQPNDGTPLTLDQIWKILSSKLILRYREDEPLMERIVAHLQNELAQLSTTRERLKQVELQRDMLLGQEDEVHVGAQAAVTAIRQCESLQAENDWLRSQRDKSHDEVIQAIKILEQVKGEAASTVQTLHTTREIARELAAALEKCNFSLGQAIDRAERHSLVGEGPYTWEDNCAEARVVLAKAAGLLDDRSAEATSSDGPATPEGSQPAGDSQLQSAGSEWPHGIGSCLAKSPGRKR